MSERITNIDILDLIDQNNNSLLEEDEEINLDTLSDELLMENVKEQIKTYNLGSNIPVDYLSIFNTRCNFLINKYKKDEEEDDRNIPIIEEIMNKFNKDILKMIQKKMGINFNIDNEKDIAVLSYIFYDFFSLNYQNNLIDFIVSYIIKNKKFYIEKYSNSNKNTDTISNNKIFKNKKDIYIVINLYKIIDDIIYDDVLNFEVVVKTIIENDPDNLTNYILNNSLYNENNDNQIIIEDKNFKENFFKPLNTSDLNYNKIINEIQNTLMYIFPKKIKKNIVKYEEANVVNN